MRPVVHLKLKVMATVLCATLAGFSTMKLGNN
jgi:hypothetical protein